MTLQEWHDQDANFEDVKKTLTGLVFMPGNYTKTGKNIYV